MLLIACLLAQHNLHSQTEKPPLHGRHWVAIAGKPLGTTAGARMFDRGGNAVDAACAMLGVLCTMYDDLSWGGETQALIYDPRKKKVVGINALGVAPTGAKPEFFKSKRMRYPPGEGPLAALTPGTAGAIMTMLSEYGTMSLKQVLEPAMQMAEGYPIEEEAAGKIERHKETLKRWPYSRKTFLSHPGEGMEGPRPGEIFRQPDLLKTLQKLVETEAQALKGGKDRKQAIQAAYDRFYKGDIAEEFVRGAKEQGALLTLADLAKWQVKIEEPIMTTYKGLEVYKLTGWTQGPALLEMLNMLEPLDVREMGFNSARYIHTLYQVMNLALADRDFYYGDPYFPPEEPIRGLLSKSYARERLAFIDRERNDPDAGPGDPYPFENKKNPFGDILRNWSNTRTERMRRGEREQAQSDDAFRAGTTSLQAMDKAGWAVSITPSGGWMPACIAGNTGIGMSQRMQSFVLDEAESPFNVVAPGKRPRVTLSPSIALKQGRPVLCFGAQGGDWQEQWLLQFLINIVEFGMTVQEACEAPNFWSYQVRASFERHEAQPGRLTLNEEVPSWVRKELRRMGYRLDFRKTTSGPITAIYFDTEQGTFWGGAATDGEDYGLAW